MLGAPKPIKTNGSAAQLLHGIITVCDSSLCSSFWLRGEVMIRVKNCSWPFRTEPGEVRILAALKNKLQAHLCCPAPSSLLRSGSSECCVNKTSPAPITHCRLYLFQTPLAANSPVLFLRSNAFTASLCCPLDVLFTPRLLFTPLKDLAWKDTFPGQLCAPTGTGKQIGTRLAVSTCGSGGDRREKGKGGYLHSCPENPFSPCEQLGVEAIKKSILSARASQLELSCNSPCGSTTFQQGVQHSHWQMPNNWGSLRLRVPDE